MLFLKAFFYYSCFFSIRVFLNRHWRFTGQQGKGRDHLLFHPTTSTCSQTPKHLLATLRVRWQSHVFNSNVVFTRLLLDEIYHLPGLPFEWLNDDPMFISLLHDLILGFCYITLIKTSGFKLTSTKMLSWYKQ